jgi:tRNA(Arg) A34 adenosine deaminase TadA
MTPTEIMARAIQISRDEMRTRGYRPFAAIIARGGEIVAEGCNDSVESFDPTAHGEVVAIRNATKKLGTADLSGHDIYTTCEPCSLCVAAIYWAKLDKMYYANTLEDCAKLGIDCDELVSEVSKPIAQRKLPTERILAEEAHTVFDEWAASPAFDRP